MAAKRKNYRSGTRKRRLQGWGAIEFAERHDIRYVSKYADPIERAKKRITLDHARDVAREDSRLVYLDVSPKKLLENPRRHMTSRRKKNPVRVAASMAGKSTGWMPAKAVRVVKGKGGQVRVDVKR